MNAIPYVVCNASTKWSGRPMDEVGNVAFLRVSMRRLGSGTGADGKISRPRGLDSGRIIELRRAKTVRRGALDATILARGRVGTWSRHASLPIESHPLLLADRPVSTGRDRTSTVPEAAEFDELSVKSRGIGNGSFEGPIRDLTSRDKAPPWDCRSPRSRIEANDDRTVPPGGVVNRRTTHRHPRGKGVLAA